MAKRIFVAVVRDGVIEGDFALVADVDPLGDVDALKQRIKASRSRLRDVELGDMTVFGVWGEQPRLADAARLMGEEPCRTAAILSDLVGGLECAFFIVRISAPRFAGVTDHFLAVLAGAGVLVDEAVVRRIYESAALSVRLQIFSTLDEALLLYEAAQRVPQSETRTSVQRETGFVVGGDISMPHSSTALFSGHSTVVPRGWSRSQRGRTSRLASANCTASWVRRLCDKVSLWSLSTP